MQRVRGWGAHRSAAALGLLVSAIIGLIGIVSLASKNFTAPAVPTKPAAAAPTSLIDPLAVVVRALRFIPRPTPPSHYGFSANEIVWMGANQRDQRLTDMKAAGAGWVRLDMQWYVVQPSNAATYDWSVYDRTIDAINRHGLRALVILDYAPAWAASSGCRPSSRHRCAPADPQVFATYAAAAAARYTPRGVNSWEIWNEPNAPSFWYPRVDAAGYAAVLKATYPAIKRINKNATVITAGLRASNSSGDVSPYDYMTALYAAGARPYFDAIGAHPYSYPLLPSISAARSGWTQMLKIHDIAASQGDAAKKIWITEVGAATGGPHPISEALQARIVTEAAQLRNSYPWAGPLFWYDYQDLGRSQSTDENFYGLVRWDGSHKPAYDSFVQATAR